MTARALGALAVAAVLCALGAQILGEYEFEGTMPYIAGVLFGLVIGEVVVELGHLRSIPVALAGAVLVGAGLLWAAYIASSEGLLPFPPGGWIAGAIGAVAAGVRCAPPRRRPG